MNSKSISSPPWCTSSSKFFAVAQFIVETILQEDFEERKHFAVNDNDFGVLAGSAPFSRK
ncbi:hypothetical protein BLA27_09525 [Brucella cytisi]|uniref:Uncharacterized protein n=1 Tax=Brucella cytisi TaxID=407152 RepID=A0A1J6I4T8_9HYPH|nr:hypothetical protein BLA27_09525 [Brucella cytisi]